MVNFIFIIQGPMPYLGLILPDAGQVEPGPVS